MTYLRYAMFGLMGVLLSSGGIDIWDWRLYAILTAAGVACFCAATEAERTK